VCVIVHLDHDGPGVVEPGGQPVGVDQEAAVGARPVQQVGIDPVVDPEARAPRRNDADGPQHAEVPRHLGMRQLQRLVQDADQRSPAVRSMARMRRRMGSVIAFPCGGPAVNVLAIIVTARTLGLQIRIAWAVVGGIGFSVPVGALVAVLFRKKDRGRLGHLVALPREAPRRSLGRTVVYFALVVPNDTFTGSPIGRYFAEPDRTFDADTAPTGKSACNGPAPGTGRCSRPATLMAATIVTPHDGWPPWVSKVRALYCWSKGTKLGDTRGDGVTCVWRVARP
jgi:hypothetical protein